MISCGFGTFEVARRRLFLLVLLRDDVVAELDALVADVDGRARDQLLDFLLALAAEGAGEVRVVVALLHVLAAPRIPRRARRCGIAAADDRADHLVDEPVVHAPPRPSYSSRARCRARSAATGLPRVLARISFMRSRSFRISRAWISMSVAWPWTPPRGWWIMTRELGSAHALALRARRQEHRAPSTPPARCRAWRRRGGRTASCRRSRARR